MDVRLLFPSLYLTAVDLHGKDANLTIRRVIVDTLKTDRGDEKKPVMYFKETKEKADKTGAKEKRLVLNKTNALAIAALHGNEVDAWAGKRVTLYATTCEAFGKQADCIRVRPTIPNEET